jgi:hypothetical protein
MTGKDEREARARALGGLIERTFSEPEPLAVPARLLKEVHQAHKGLLSRAWRPSWRVALVAACACACVSLVVAETYRRQTQTAPPWNLKGPLGGAGWRPRR